MVQIVAVIWLDADTQDQVEVLKRTIAERLDSDFEAFQDIAYGPSIPCHPHMVEADIPDPGVFSRDSLGG